MRQTVGERRHVRSFYRIAKQYPPADDEYLTMLDRRGSPRPHVPPEQRHAWDALSAYDSADAAAAKAIEIGGRRGWLIVRYDIPLDAAVRWEQTFGPGHYSLWSDREELKRYLTDWVVDIKRPASAGSEG